MSCVLIDARTKGAQKRGTAPIYRQRVLCLRHCLSPELLRCTLHRDLTLSQVKEIPVSFLTLLSPLSGWCWDSDNAQMNDMSPEQLQVQPVQEGPSIVS
ncbi:hypothetical protein KUCAC02_023197 [Chaenocephalus aceratus]|uniref:Uncharacterized protein n=1 Tax=Chaenocephalus aceratus TaxID=36190 RepID=A0ACB9XQL7_CHAAC|nr:hypothetical protein KUCAC02_023197 [Chaenocephalus aceratus]